MQRLGETNADTRSASYSEHPLSVIVNDASQSISCPSLPPPGSRSWMTLAQRPPRPADGLQTTAAARRHTRTHKEPARWNIKRTCQHGERLSGDCTRRRERYGRNADSRAVIQLLSLPEAAGMIRCQYSRNLQIHTIIIKNFNHVKSLQMLSISHKPS